ncbi:MAG: 50S ribosomal protein L24 [Candidatus Wildermuthbacteria bacterium]|nr:50S ribosomal protein L24 [Candidatus Wildermuthbacteria bacterium]
MNIKKGDTVLVISGKDKGKKGAVRKVLRDEGRVVVEGVNIRKRHRRPVKTGEKGQVVDITLPVAVSNIMLVCPKCGKATRTQKKAQGEIKIRACKKCQSQI